MSLSPTLANVVDGGEHARELLVGRQRLRRPAGTGAREPVRDRNVGGRALVRPTKERRS